MKRTRRDGFTLLELLLAISLVSLITATIMEGIHLGRRSWESGRASEALDEIEAAMRAATWLIGKSFVVDLDQANLILSKEPPSIFLGTVNGCRMVMLSEGGAQWGGLILAEIAVDSGPDGNELAVWTKVYRTGEGLATAREAMRKTVLLKGLAWLEFSYFGSKQKGQAPAWSSGWRSANELPALVYMKIGIKRFGRVIEVASTVAIRQQ